MKKMAVRFILNKICQFKIHPDKSIEGLCVYLRLPYTAKHCGLPKGPLVCPTDGKKRANLYDLQHPARPGQKREGN
jgi:hypothetical protein